MGVEKEAREQILNHHLQTLNQRVYNYTYGNKSENTKNNALNAIKMLKNELTKTDKMTLTIEPYDIFRAATRVAAKVMLEGREIERGGGSVKLKSEDELKSAVVEEVKKVLSKYDKLTAELEAVEAAEAEAVKAAEAGAEAAGTEEAGAEIAAAKGGRRKRKSKKSKKSKRSRRGKKQIKKTKKYKKRSNKK